MLEKFADTLQTHQDGILAHYDYLVFEGFLNIPCVNLKFCTPIA
jgi:hypothetical protein